MKLFALTVAGLLLAAGPVLAAPDPSAAPAAVDTHDDHHEEAHATAPGLGDRVFSADVIGDEIEFALRSARLEGGKNAGESALVAELGYGWTDRLYTALLLVGGAGALHDDFDAEAVAVEAIFQVAELPGGIAMALYGEYAAEREADDGVSVKALFSRQTSGLDARLNLGVHRSLGEDHTVFGYGASALWRINPTVGVGVQAFGDIGDQDSFGGRRAHYLGPVAELRLVDVGSHAELGLEAGYLFAAGEAKDVSDGQTRFLVGVKRHLNAPGGHGAASGHGTPAPHGGEAHAPSTHH